VLGCEVSGTQLGEHGNVGVFRLGDFGDETCRPIWRVVPINSNNTTTIRRLRCVFSDIPGNIHIFVEVGLVTLTTLASGIGIGISFRF
jgi:hypothetical protein